MTKLAELFETAVAPADYAEQFCAYFIRVVQAVDADEVAGLIEIIDEVNRADNTVFLVANGGSAAVAGHWVMDLSANSVLEGHKGFKVVSLADNAFAMTALANDTSFDEIFRIQLKANMRPGDVVIALSVSGNSPNVIHAVEYANDHGGKTVGMTGFDGGKLKEICHHSIHIPTSKDEYGPVEDIFGVVMHVVTGYLTMKRGRRLHH